METIAGIRIPDSDIAIRAKNLAKQVSDEVVYNHAMRTFVFGALVANQRQLEFDEELFFLGAVLHDLGLTERFCGVERFEVCGANAARTFLAEHGIAQERAEIVWDAIALHTSVGIADQKRPEIALVHIGAGVDVLGLGIDDISDEVVEQTIAALPRLDFKRAFFEILVATVQRAPAATRNTWMSDIARMHVHGYDCPSFEQMMQAAPW